MNKVILISFTSIIYLSAVICNGIKRDSRSEDLPIAQISNNLFPDKYARLFQDEKLPVIKELPDPFLLNNGIRISTKSQWIAHREELKERIMHYEYGHLAPASPVLEVISYPDSIIKSPGGNIAKRVVSLKTGPGGAISFTINLFVPAKVQKAYPVIIDGDLCWGSLLKRLKPGELADLVNRGYLIAEFDRTIFAPDKNIRNEGVFPLYPQYDWGALAAWAWGFHRTVDYLLTQMIVDKDKIVVTGWSRGGKACLLAGALDERIALVAPNCSGTSGAGPIRYVESGAERIDDIAKRFPYWFNASFQEFIGDNRFKLPFDQSTLVALIAPRAYLCTNGLQDLWANPRGTAQAHLAAKEVWTALGAENKTGIYYGNTGHDHNIDKWIALLDFADLIFYGKKSLYDYESIPFNNLEKAYSWSTPVKLH